MFIGIVKKRLHIGFEDPDEVTVPEEEIITEFKRIRNEILRNLFTFYNTKINNYEKYYKVITRHSDTAIGNEFLCSEK